jgi:hypothetical protein
LKKLLKPRQVTVEPALGPLKNGWKYFGSVEKTIEKLWVCWKLMKQTLCMLEKLLKKHLDCWKNCYDSVGSVDKNIERTMGLLKKYCWQKYGHLKRTRNNLWSVGKLIEKLRVTSKLIKTLWTGWKGRWKIFGSVEKLVERASDRLKNCWNSFEFVEKHVETVLIFLLLKTRWFCWKNSRKHFGGVFENNWKHLASVENDENMFGLLKNG